VKIVACVVLFLFCSMMVSGETMRRKLSIAASEWEPFTGNDLPEKGLLCDLVTEIFKMKGYDVAITIYPWSRAFEYVKNGTCDALIGASYLNDRTEYFSYTDSLYSNEICFYTHTDNTLKILDYSKLSGVRISVLQDSFLVNELFSIKGVNIETSPTIESNILKVVKKRVDYSVESVICIEYMLRSFPREDRTKIKFLYPPYKVDKVYCVISKKARRYEDITEDFNRALAQIRASGYYNEILKKHGFGVK